MRYLHKQTPAMKGHTAYYLVRSLFSNEQQAVVFAGISHIGWHHDSFMISVLLVAICDEGQAYILNVASHHVYGQKIACRGAYQQDWDIWCKS